MARQATLPRMPSRSKRYKTGEARSTKVQETLRLFRPMKNHPETLTQAAPAYRTSWGAMFQGDAGELLAKLPSESVNLVITSPPYALHFKKEYGNVEKSMYVDRFRRLEERSSAF